MSDYTEEFQCNDCGETWIWTGANQCPFCESQNIDPVKHKEDLE